MNWKCEICERSFESRNGLFRHLRAAECKRDDGDGDASSKLLLKSSDDHQQLKKLKQIHDVIDRRNCNENVWIYVVGGRLRGRTLSAVHRYSIQEDRWESNCPPMLENRGSHGALCLNGRIYAIGN